MATLVNTDTMTCLEVNGVRRHVGILASQSWRLADM